MSINFISDLHLDKSRPHINNYFIHYLKSLNSNVSDLYILGDLFEYWVGDDDPMIADTVARWEQEEEE